MVSVLKPRSRTGTLAFPAILLCQRWYQGPLQGCAQASKSWGIAGFQASLQTPGSAVFLGRQSRVSVAAVHEGERLPAVAPKRDALRSPIFFMTEEDQRLPAPVALEDYAPRTLDETFRLRK